MKLYNIENHFKTHTQKILSFFPIPTKIYIMLEKKIPLTHDKKNALPFFDIQKHTHPAPRKYPPRAISPVRHSSFWCLKCKHRSHPNPSPPTPQPAPQTTIALFFEKVNPIISCCLNIYACVSVCVCVCACFTMLSMPPHPL